MKTVLTDLIPAKARKYVYAVLFLAAFGYGLWQANDGDWNQVIAAALPILVGALAVSNTDVVPDPQPITVTVNSPGAGHVGHVGWADGCVDEHSPATNPNCEFAPQDGAV